MKVLVTGAAGFIGSNLVHYLVAERPSWRITALDSLTYAGNLANLGSLTEQKKITFVKGDITDTELIAKLFADEQYDLVMHLAAESHVDRSIMSASEFVKTNVLGTQVLLNATLALHRGTETTKAKKIRFVHISTDEVYGSLGPTGLFYETTPLEPTSPYAASKAASDLMVFAAARTHHLDALVTRCTNNYGPYQFPEKFIPLFVSNCLEGKKLPLYGNGANVRSWIHVRDHCEGLLLAAEKGRTGEAYNLGSDVDGELPNVEVARRIMKILGTPAEQLQLVADRPAHDFRYAVDFSKATRELGWKPRTVFEEGLAATIDWYQKNRSWWQEIKSGAYRSYYERNYTGRL
jgi:dTDP-glucose 4,6-dehydratase